MIEEIIRKIIREELAEALKGLGISGEKQTAQVEEPVKTRIDLPIPSKADLIEEIPEMPDNKIKNASDLMAAMRELCDRPGMAVKAKALLKDEFNDVEKFSEVADHACQDVYDFMVSNKERLL